MANEKKETDFHLRLTPKEKARLQRRANEAEMLPGLTSVIPGSAVVQLSVHLSFLSRLHGPVQTLLQGR